MQKNIKRFKWKEKYHLQSKNCNPYVFFKTLSENTNKNDVIIPDSSANLIWAMQSIEPSNQKIFTALNHSPMGYSMPATIGAYLADKSKNVICTIGDGSMQMNIQELAMLSGSLRNQTYIIVFNNNGYDSIRRSQKSYLGKYYNSDKKTGLRLPNLKLLSEAYDVNYLEIRKLCNLENFLEENPEKGVFVLEVFISENVPSGPKISPKMLEDGSIVSGSLTDLQ